MYAVDAMKFFQKSLFKLQNAEIWIDAPSETLGGTLFRKIEKEDPYSLSEIVSSLLSSLPYDQASESIVIFNGTWNFDDISLSGYFSIQNSYTWRKVYHEIEINAYAKKDLEDLVDALWKTMPQDTTSLVQKFITALHQTTVRSGRLGLSRVLFCIGVPTEEDPTNLMAAHLTGERKSLLRIFYTALRRSRDPKVISKIKPLRDSFFIDTIHKEEVVQERLSKKIQSALIVEKKGDSATYIAKDRKSFGTLYREITDIVLRPALGKLLDSQNVTELIESGLREHEET